MQRLRGNGDLHRRLLVHQLLAQLLWAGLLTVALSTTRRVLVTKTAGSVDMRVAQRKPVWSARVALIQRDSQSTCALGSALQHITKNCLIPTKQESYDWEKFMGGMERNLMLNCWCLNSMEDLWACSEIYIRVTQMIWYHCNIIALKSTITYQKYLLQDNKCIIVHNLQMKQKWFTLHCTLSELQNAGLQHTTWSLGVWPSSSV